MKTVFKQNTDQKVPVKMWDEYVPMESGVYDQVINLASLPFVYKHVAVMPDAHVGKGATVGSVFASKGAIVPSAVGVDIGCGMIAFRLSLKAHNLPDNLKEIFDEMSKQIPLGQAQHKEAHNQSKQFINNLESRLDTILKKNPGINKILGKSMVWSNQLGTLGGGNHFIELCIDESDDVWLMIHSGSRKIGNAIGTYFISEAQKVMKDHFIQLPDKDLAYLVGGSDKYNEYIEAMTWAQDYASHNRTVMGKIALDVLKKYLPPFQLTKEAVNCHHNFISLENHFGENVFITRKGAIRARETDFGIIPGSMGTKSYIVKGKGNAQSFCSCSHGAGRVYSRGKAKELISVEDHLKDTEGVVCRKDAGVLDESPRAYKDIDSVMESQKDLVEIVHTLKQIMCIKG